MLYNGLACVFVVMNVGWVSSTADEIPVPYAIRQQITYSLHDYLPCIQSMSTTCPPPCTCCIQPATSDVVVTCRNSNLTKIPSNLPDNTNILDLTFNLIENVTSDELKLLNNLKILLLSKNIISKLQFGCFDSLYNLKTLYLDSNELCMDYSIFEPGLFRNLSRLTELNIRNNQPTHTRDVLAKTFGDLISLETLVIDNLLDGSYFGEEYKNLRQLKTVNVSISARWVPVYETALTEQTFASIAGVQNLILFNCNIRNMTGSTFERLHSLSLLDMRQNYIYSGKIIASLIIAKSSVLKQLILSNNKDWRRKIYLDDRSVEFLFFSNIEILKLDNLGINGMDTPATDVKYTGHLSFLSITRNELSYGTYLHSLLQFMYNLTELDASYQFPSREIWQNRDAPNTPQLRCPSWNVTAPPNLKRLHLKQSHLTGCIPEMDLENSKLTYVDMSGNQLTEWHGPVKGVHSLTYLDLSNNYCNFISNQFFNQMSSLKILMLENNNIGYIIENDENGDLLGGLTNLRHLDIANNNIYKVPKKLFSRNLMLEKLDIHSNYIKTMDSQFLGLHLIQMINVSTNHLMEISEGVRGALDQMHHTHPVIIDISKNNLQCLCSEKGMFDWWRQTTVRVVVHGSDMCDLPNGTVVSVNNTLEIQQSLQHHCIHYTYLMMGTSFCIAITIAIILAGIVRRYRWKLRYLYYMTKAKHKGYSRLTDQESNTYLWDAFISYADEQFLFVKDCAMSYLETNYDLSLCIHHRDFVPGESIASNITKAVHSSRKTVILLTMAFLKSYWCVYELNIALAESAYTNRDVIVFVKLEDIPESDIPMEILYQFNCFTYLQYPTTVDDQPGFWATLARAIQTE